MTTTHPSADRSIQPASAGWWMFLIWGITSALLGAVLLMQPAMSALVLVTTVAAFWLIGGVVDIVGGVLRRTDHWGWRIAGGVFSVIVSIFVLGHPFVGTIAAVSTLYVLIGMSALFNGLTGLLGGDRSTGRVVLSILQIVLAGLMLIGFLDIANLRLLVQAIGVITIGGGIVAVISAFHFKSPARTGV